MMSLTKGATTSTFSLSSLVGMDSRNKEWKFREDPNAIRHFITRGIMWPILYVKHNKFMEHKYDTKATYNLANKLLFWNEALALPSSVNNLSLANDISTFFCDKITKIMKALEPTSPDQIDTSYIVRFSK